MLLLNFLKRFAWLFDEYELLPFWWRAALIFSISALFSLSTSLSTTPNTSSLLFSPRPEAASTAATPTIASSKTGGFSWCAAMSVLLGVTMKSLDLGLPEDSVKTGDPCSLDLNGTGDWLSCLTAGAGDWSRDIANAGDCSPRGLLRTGDWSRSLDANMWLLEWFPRGENPWWSEADEVSFTKIILELIQNKDFVYFMNVEEKSVKITTNIIINTKTKKKQY